MSLLHKGLLIEDIGVHLVSIEHYDHRIHLYSLHGLLIEMRYDVETKHLISVESISYEDMDKYLSRILIHDILNRQSNTPTFFI